MAQGHDAVPPYTSLIIVMGIMIMKILMIVMNMRMITEACLFYFFTISAARQKEIFKDFHKM